MSATGRPEVDALIDRALAGEPRAAARLMTALESDPDAVPYIMAAVYPKASSAHVIGVTGPPGAGKSTLVDKMAAALRAQDRTVGIVAVDPSSPFSGGALLGDRIRMQDRFADSGVFIRSMASRGQPGGLAKASQNVVALMSAMGKDVVLVETVGVGQEEIDVIRVADTTIVVLVPGLGDAVQTMKAGLLEVADVFAINKADRDGAERLFKDLNLMVHSGMQDGEWSPPVLKTVASEGRGTVELLSSGAEHLEFMRASGQYDQRRCQAATVEINAILRDRLLSAVLEQVPAFERYAQEVGQRKYDPYTAVTKILDQSVLLEAHRG
ncbi:MAG TPA: methylmalonyl Co-A mutase-associated GTPase MeaB [Chloroflexota bacterium]|nr:methylmalonyl Co-A mutase-associated GTPase MeaB [Chloroflexota bacterium]